MIPFFNETYKGILLLWNYKVNLVMESLIIALVFVGLNFLTGNGQITSEAMASSLVGFVIWLYTFMAVSNMGWGLREELQTGTLEQVYLSPAPPELLILGRALATFMTSTLSIGLIVLFLVPLFGLHIPLNLTGLFVFGWTILGLLGLGFMVGGATLIFKQIESFIYLVQYSLMFLTGALMPLDRFPPWLADMARLLPGTLGIDLLRRALLEGESLDRLGAALFGLILHSVLFLAAGWFVFKTCERVAKREGSLGHY